MRTFADVNILGYVGQDPETRTVSGDVQITTFSVAVSEERKDKAGEKIKTTSWFNCTAFNRTAEIIATHVKKGNAVYVKGRLKIEEYEKDGVKKYATKVIVGEIVMLPKGDKAAGGAGTSAENDCPF